jgi:hypothetical protein
LSVYKGVAFLDLPIVTVRRFRSRRDSVDDVQLRPCAICQLDGRADGRGGLLGAVGG